MKLFNLCGTEIEEQAKQTTKEVTLKLRCRSWTRSLTQVECPPSLLGQNKQAEYTHLMQLIGNTDVVQPTIPQNEKNYTFKLRRSPYSKQNVLTCSPDEPFSLPSQETGALSQQGRLSFQPINGAFHHRDVKDEVINISHFKVESIFIQHRTVNG